MHKSYAPIEKRPSGAKARYLCALLRSDLSHPSDEDLSPGTPVLTEKPRRVLSDGYSYCENGTARGIVIESDL